MRRDAVRSAGAVPGIYPLVGFEALTALIDCLRLRLPLLLTGLAGRTFEALTALSRDVAMFRFVRPRDLEPRIWLTQSPAAAFWAKPRIFPATW